MIPRTLAKRLRQAATQLPVVTVTGPRQSGKTTLVRAEFKDYEYVSLDLPDERNFALEDPRGFLSRFRNQVILDEVQRAPELFSYIQAIVDERGASGQFVLTGSHNFLLLESISQSLAGRCSILNLLPFSLSELMNRPALSLESLGQTTPRKPAKPRHSLMETLFTGFYPRIHDKNLPPRDWLSGYIQTYLERDVRNVLHVGDLEAFGRFLRLCAGRCGQLLNLSSLAADCGMTHTTARRWLSILEASFVVMLLRPHYKNFGKRLIKSPKLYFLDTGLLCFLLQIRSAEELYIHAARGAVFESFVLSELCKNFVNRGEPPSLYFWRDAAGHEVDIVMDLGRGLLPLEVKSGQTIAADYFDDLDYWRSLCGKSLPPAALVYGGDPCFKRRGIAVYPWFTL